MGETFLQDQNKPLFYAKGQTVWKQPIGRRNPNGTTNWSLGFPVCTAHDCVDANDIAGALTLAETSRDQPADPPTRSRSDERT